jgi:chemotaxis protein methyltransferase CheR
LADVALLRVVALALAERDRVRRRTTLRALRDARAVALDDVTAATLEMAFRDEADLDLRTAAIEAAGALGNAVLPLLQRVLGDGDARVRRLAVDALALVGGAASDVLVGAFRDPLLAVRASAVDAYARTAGAAGVPTLVAMLEEGDTIPAVALAALIGIEAASATAPRAVLRRWLTDAMTAAAALRLAGRAGDLEAVLPALTSASASRRRAALLGLGEALDNGVSFVAVDGARDALLVAAGDAELSVAAAAVNVLGHAGDAEALARLTEGLDASRLLAPLHRAVSLLPPQKQELLEQLLPLDDSAPEAAREIRDALARVRMARIRAPASIEAPVVDPSSRTSAPGTDVVEYRALQRWLASEVGLSLTGESHVRLAARLLPRVEATREFSVSAYVERLQRDPVEAAAAIDAVTVHETYFFRERAALDAFRKEMVPTLAARSRRLRVWSAGCSSGEEAWSLAIVLDDALRDGVIDDFEVLGTDVSQPSIARAVEGRYRRRSFRGDLAESDRARFEWHDDVASVVSRLRARVRFECLNLIGVGASTLPVVDAVFCRNVLIYLTPDARARVISLFHEKLVDGGGLFLGHSESLLNVESPFAMWPLRGAIAYRRPAP